MGEQAKTIYIVTTGVYSDYTVRGVFDQHDVAESYVASFGGDDDVRIEHHLLNAPSDMRGDRHPYFVVIDRQGHIRSIDRTDPGIADLQDEVRDVTVWSAPHPREHFPALHVHCWARDPDHAAKIAGERRARMLAEGHWPEQETGAG